MTVDTRQRAWETLARADPLWAVCTRSDLRGRGWDEESFFATGAVEIAWMLDLLRADGAMPARTVRVLDFGSGAGRLSRALAGTFDEVVGVDFSPSMRALAAELTPLPALSFLASLSDVPTGSVDLVYSSLVLQHVAPNSLDDILAGFRRVLAPGGALVVQFPTRPRSTLRGLGFRLLPGPVVARLQTWVLRYPAPMTMSWMSVRKFRDRLAAAGLPGAVAHDGLRNSPDWRDVWYVVRRD